MPKIFCLNSKMFCSKSGKIINFFKKRQFLTQRFFWTFRCSFDTPADTVFAQLPRIMIEKYDFSRKLIPWNVSLEPYKVSLPGVPKLFVEILKNFFRKSMILSEKKLCSKNFFWTRWRQVWQRCWNFAAKTPQILTENDDNFYTKKS